MRSGYPKVMKLRIKFVDPVFTVLQTHTGIGGGRGRGGEESVEYGQALFTPPYLDLFRKDFA